MLVAAPLAAQNLFVNADLNTDTTSWVVGCGTLMTWTSADESLCAGSGSAHVTSGPCQGFQGAGAGQCVPVAGLATLFASGRVRASAGFVGVVIGFFDGPDCTGTLIDSINSAAGGATHDWQTVSLADVVVPTGTATALVGFGAVNSTVVDADIDTGYAGGLPLVFRDDFEGDLEGAASACRWSVVSP
jgi:hypothetical protein